MATKIDTARATAGSPIVPAPPPLESGDRLPRAEFERRYEAMPWVKKAELVEGVVYMGSPVRQRSHGKPHSMLITWPCSRAQCILLLCKPSPKKES